MAPRKETLQLTKKPTFNYIKQCAHICLDKATCRHKCCAPQGYVPDLAGFDDFFNINELLVITLEGLPAEALLAVRQVSKRFRALVDGTATFQRMLMLQPSDDLPSLRCALTTAGPPNRPGPNQFHILPDARPDVWAALPTRDLIINPLLLEDPSLRTRYVRRSGHQYRTVKVVRNPDIGNVATSLLAKMFLTQPPTKEIYLYLEQHASSGLATRWSCRREIMVARGDSQGITWGDVVEFVRDLNRQAAGPHAGAWLVTTWTRFSYIVIPGLK